MSERSVARRWVLAAALASFGAGLVVGLVVPAIVEAVSAEGELEPDERYALELRDTYDLDAEQVRQIRVVLEERERQKRRVLLQDLERLPETLRQEVRRADRRAEERIKYVLTDAQRERFLRDSALAEGASGVGPAGAVKSEDR